MSDTAPAASPPPATAPAPTPPDDTVTLSIDGHPVTARKGELIIAAADRAGVYIPRFCYHPRMKPVGMCRMCIVEVKGPRGSALTPACFNPVGQGQEIFTTSHLTKKAQDGVLEFLLVNHPLDCPVCDKGGECPLQDQTLAYGPGETRFVEEKRHWDKPIPISALVNLDRERCIQCARCTRFAEEVAGDPLIDFLGRGDTIEVATYPDDPFNSYFSGNIVQICPVGALTSQPYRFRARPWDLEQVESSCTSCSVGCRVAVQSSSDELTRYIGIDSDPVNWGWLCDKGRFDYEAILSPERVSVPLIRIGDELVEVSWAEALTAAAEGLAAAKAVGGGGALAVIGGARLANEDAYVWAKLARTVLGTDHVDAQLGDGLPADVLLGLPRATIDQAAAAPLILTLAPDLKEELPVLYLRLRHAAVEGGVPIVELTPRSTGLSRYAAQTVLYRPGEAAALVRALTGSGPVTGEVAGVPAAVVDEVRGRISQAWEKGGPDAPSIVVVLGRPSLAESGASVAEAAQVLAGLPGVAFLTALRRSNVHGALDLGLAPGVLPGRVSLADGRSWYEHHWAATLPAGTGLDTAGVLDAAARGRIGGLVLLGADPLVDFPGRSLATRGLDGARFVVAVDTFLTESARRADVIFPAATYAERRGTFTNLEGRISWLGQMVTAPGVAWPDWMIAGELAVRMGADLGFSSLEEIWAEIEEVSPLHHGVGYDLIHAGSSRDGVGVPLAAGAPAPSRALDPMAGAGIVSAELHSLPPLSLAVARAWANPVPAPTGDLAAPAEVATAAGMTAPADPHAAASAAAAAPAGAPAEVAAGSAATTARPAAGAGSNDPADRGAETDRTPTRPPTLTVSAPGPAGVIPPLDRYSLRLVATRSMWDAGTLVQHSPSLAKLHPALALRIHPSEVDRLGVADGDHVRVTSARGVLVLPVQRDPGVPRGSAAVLYNHPEGSASVLIDATAGVTDVRLETVPGGRA